MTGNLVVGGRKEQAEPDLELEAGPEAGRDGVCRVTLKLFASLACYLPAEADRNSVRVELLPEERTALDLLRRFRVPPEAVHLLLVNGFYLDRNQRAGEVLRDGDVVAIWPPVAGG